MGGRRCQPPSDIECRADRPEERGPDTESQPTGALHQPDGLAWGFELDPVPPSWSSFRSDLFVSGFQPNPAGI